VIIVCNISIREKRLNEDRDLLVRQQEFFRDELDKRTKEVLNIRRELTSKLLESQTELAEKTEEVLSSSVFVMAKILISLCRQVSQVQKSVTELTAANQDLKNRIDQLTEELKKQDENATKIAESSR
jgi:translation initiation factor 2B subunit (eIF-2B alpha/beta/delta family)